MTDKRLILCYNTNGFYCHTLEDAARIIADLGYDGVALTPDVHHLNPFEARARHVKAFAALLDRLGLEAVVETGARFILDPWKKHHPSLLSPGQGERRLDFLERCAGLAADLGASVVSFHSGGLEEGVSREEGWNRLSSLVARFLDSCLERGVRPALEPEPGMFIGTLGDFEGLKRRLPRTGLFLTMDVGHVHITEEASIAGLIRKHASDLVNVHLDDARDGRHEHLPLGEGEIDFPPLLHALAGLEKTLLLSVELSRHGHDAVNQAGRALSFLRGILPSR